MPAYFDNLAKKNCINYHKIVNIKDILKSACTDRLMSVKIVEGEKKWILQMDEEGFKIYRHGNHARSCVCSSCNAVVSESFPSI
jgi:hypothetical protein